MALLVILKAGSPFKPCFGLSGAVFNLANLTPTQSAIPPIARAALHNVYKVTKAFPGSSSRSRAAARVHPPRHLYLIDLPLLHRLLNVPRKCLLERDGARLFQYAFKKSSSDEPI